MAEDKRFDTQSSDNELSKPETTENIEQTKDINLASESSNDTLDTPVIQEEHPTYYGESPHIVPGIDRQNQNIYIWDGEANAIKKQKKQRKSVIATVFISLLLVASMIVWTLVASGGLGGGLHGGTDTSISDNQQKPSAPEVIKVGEVPTEYISDLTEIYESVYDSCLTVFADTSMGSGFVITEDGYIITNHHVVSKTKTVKIEFYNGDKYDAEIIGSDSMSDIAVLKIDATGLKPLAIGNSDVLKVGEQVVAIGTPYGHELAGTMNTGIISGTNRKIEVTNDSGKVVKTMTLLQTDTSINPGNSGGPLINMAGQIIGINTLKLMDEYEGLGFAIPINNAVSIINTLIEYGEVEERPDDDFVKANPRLHITVMNVEDAVNEYNINAQIELPAGVFVIDVLRDSAIYRAGLEFYDIITEFNGVEIPDKEVLTSELVKYRAGQTVTIKVFRLNRLGTKGTYHEFTFKLDTVE